MDNQAVSPDQPLQEILTAIRHQNWLLAVVGIAWAGGVFLHLWIAKRIESAIENKQHFSRLRYEHELGLYREVWKKLRVHSENSFGRFQWDDNEPEAQAKSKALQDSGRSFSETLRDNRPFYPAEIRAELQKFLEICDELARVQGRMLGASVSANEGLGRLLEQNLSEAKAQYQRVEDAIRHRLNKFGGD